MVKFRTEEEGGLRKPANYQCTYTEEQAYDFLVRCPKDPIYFIRNYCYIIHPRLGRMKFDLYDYQEKLIRHYVENERCVTAISMQTGKTETAAAFLLWY